MDEIMIIMIVYFSCLATALLGYGLYYWFIYNCRRQPLDADVQTIYNDRLLEEFARTENGITYIRKDNILIPLIPNELN
jgi:hypothetical protein